MTLPTTTRNSRPLQGQLTDLTTGTFNGVSLFASGGSTLSVGISADGSLTQTITQANLAGQDLAITGASSLSSLADPDHHGADCGGDDGAPKTAPRAAG